MAKNPNQKPKKTAKQDISMTAAINFLIFGCLAELFLMVVRRCYVNGYAEQQIAWYDVYLKALIPVGAAILIAGVVLSYVWRQKKNIRVYGWMLSGLGAFVAAASALVLWNMTALSPLSTLVLVMIALGIAWSLYDRECALSLTLLGASLFAAWICRSHISSIYVGTYVKLGVVALIVAVIVVAVLAKQGTLAINKAGLPGILGSCGLSVLALAACMLGPVIAYYTMWVLGVVVFGLVVYYTIKQL